MCSHCTYYYYVPYIVVRLVVYCQPSMGDAGWGEALKGALSNLG